MYMHQGRFVWVNGKPKHVSQLNKLSLTQVVFTVLGMLCVGVLCLLAHCL